MYTHTVDQEIFTCKLYIYLPFNFSASFIFSSLEHTNKNLHTSLIFAVACHYQFFNDENFLLCSN